MELKFPQGFLWGAATSAHQVEGNNRDDWTEWEKENAERLAREAKNRWQSWQQEKFPEMFRPENYLSGRACDFYNRFEGDLDLAESLNNNAFRFSLEWSRIEPESGNFDRHEINYYRQLIWACRERNLEPFVTLWHWTLPVWFAKIGGFENNQADFYFSRFVKRIVEELGTQVKFWITLNEPEVYVGASYLVGRWPPQKNSVVSGIKVFRNLIKSHRAAFKVIHRTAGNFLVGIAKNLNFYEPFSANLLDKLAVKVNNYLRNDWFLNGIKDCQDFIGLNYYFHDRVKFSFNQKNQSGIFVENKNENKAVSDLGWEIYPEGIYYVLKSLKKYNKPIFITENGLADAKDEKRTDFIREHLTWVYKAIQEGADVRGYFYWSLLDNFEWDNGFWPRFGLFEVNYQTLERRRRPSADYYASICKNNGLADI